MNIIIRRYHTLQHRLLLVHQTWHLKQVQTTAETNSEWAKKTAHGFHCSACKTANRPKPIEQYSI